MSLDCYPFERRRTIGLKEQPLALDVAYEDNLLITVVDQCQNIVVYNLCDNSLMRKFPLGDSIVIDQVIYCHTGDYLACVGHKNELITVYTIFNWRQEELTRIVELNTSVNETNFNNNSNSNNNRSSQLSSIDCCQKSGNLAISFGDLVVIYKFLGLSKQVSGVCFEHIITVKLSIWALKICILENYVSITAVDHVQVLKLELLAVGGFIGYTSESADGCITWNLNTKKLVKLPTLMHNTSMNLSTYHICHPLELLGPASESIACRVSGSIYSPDYCENQLEAVVMLCKQSDNDRDPVKTTHLQSIYLSSRKDLERLVKSSSENNKKTKTAPLLKSDQYELLASVNCFVTTLTSCFVYSLHGQQVHRIQTITHPDLCVDLRPDLLNVYLLTTLGLQICSSGVCDSTFRYEWSSSADLNLNFIATDRARILTSENYVILVSCTVGGLCEVEVLDKPSLSILFDRVIQTVDQCDSISIRSNMLTYLHAMTLLNLLAQSFAKIREVKGSEEICSILKIVTATLCKQLLQKKQANTITNSRIDKAIIHLLDISMCDISIVDLTPSYL